ncbi:type IV secretory system conjugative DNA transfer family protein [Actinomycetospora soli]|uniref:type IV secretory system conjugative DNA transfer family protein n=1 Tax=Actinomycetospora soli TaxID=2893887 RepID=UPI001E4D03EC|nr:TraM recognition domain-containing protein [Actinomycetospora soli]MCD2191354.1 TraM recognition domain-containing protein [Actinomycetospora soli]
MTITPNRPTDSGPHTTLGHRLRFAAARTGPRFVRGARRSWSTVSGFAVALALNVTVSATFAAWAWVSHPRWSRLATRTADLLGQWKVLAGTAAIALLAVALLGPFTTMTVVLGFPGFVVWTVRAARAAYPHTVRGRLRTRYGHDGWATWWDLHRHVSGHAVRQTTVTMRATVAAGLPDDDGQDPGQRAAAAARRRLATELLPIGECGTWLGTSAVGPVLSRSCYAAHRDVVGLVAPPQTAKTALMGHHVIDHPGAVLTTSTKPDVYGHTAALRMRRARSRRVEVFNPEELGGVASTMRWSPVRGCANPATAAERAGALVGATSAAGGEDGTFWLDSAAKVLRCFLLAADLGEFDMRAVQRWVADPTRAAPEALDLLERRHRDVPYGWAAELGQVLHTDAKRTRESIFLTLSQSVAFMADPTVAAACCPGKNEPDFDVDRFLDDLGTLYLIISERPQASVAPLAAAFTTYVFETAKRIAADRPKGRLDPPLGLILDEAALTTPVPLDRWVADAGGRGVHIVWSVQSPSQLAQRWGREGANTIWNATNAKVVFGGLTLDADLEAISRLCGDRKEETDAGDGKVRYERVRVLPVDQLRTLPQVRRDDGRLMMFGLLVHRATPATIIRITPVWERPDVQAAGAAPAVAPIDEVLRPVDDDQPALVAVEAA